MQILLKICLELYPKLGTCKTKRNVLDVKKKSRADAFLLHASNARSIACTVETGS